MKLKLNNGSLVINVADFLEILKEITNIHWKICMIFIESNRMRWIKNRV